MDIIDDCEQLVAAQGFRWLSAASETPPFIARAVLGWEGEGGMDLLLLMFQSGRQIRPTESRAVARVAASSQVEAIIEWTLRQDIGAAKNHWPVELPAHQ